VIDWQKLLKDHPERYVFVAPDSAYETTGWAGWPDFLGTYYSRGKIIPFPEARAWARSDKNPYKTLPEWGQACKDGKLPKGMPYSIYDAYHDDPAWKGAGDFFGTCRVIAKSLRPFKEARLYSRSLGLESGHAWSAWSAEGKRPDDIPSRPQDAYPDQWKGWPDWLNSRGTPRGQMLPFEEAREKVRKLGLGSPKEWRAWCLAGNRIPGVPCSPDQYYGDQFKGYPDWLGYKSKMVGKLLPFEEARAIARGLGLKSLLAWHAWSKAGNRPPGMPSDPSSAYKNKGWKGWPDWLGYKGQCTHGRALPFEVARAKVRALGFKKGREWCAWARSGERPSDIPSNPQAVYKGQWKGMADWCGYPPTRSMRECSLTRSTKRATVNQTVNINYDINDPSGPRSGYHQTNPCPGKLQDCVQGARATG
jgi:hypothetical protein